MYSTDPVKFVIANEIERSPLLRLKRALRRKIGKALAYFVAPALTNIEHARIHNIQSGRAADGGARMSEEQLAELRAFQVNSLDLENRKKYFRSSDHTRTLHGIAPPVIETILKSDPSVRTILDVGCSYAYMDNQMAKRFPSHQFVGVDVPSELETITEDLRLPNLKIISGYALEKIEKGEIVPDLCYFSSTATTIRNPELHSYMKALAKCAKYVVFSEQIYASTDGETENPDEVDAHNSVSNHLQVHFASNQRGYLNYAHNYRAIAMEAGFEPVHYRVFIPEFIAMHWVLLVARNKNLPARD